MTARLQETVLRYRAWVFGIVAILVLCILPLWFWWWFRCGPETTLLIARHADRVSNQDALSPAGLARAQELIHVVEKAGVTAIYHSDTERARQTAAPLATALGLTPSVYPANNTAELVAAIFANHEGQKVLVIGHSNTVPLIIAAAGGPTIPDILPDEFDNLFVVTACRCRRASTTLVNLQYGLPSP